VQRNTRVVLLMLHCMSALQSASARHLPAGAPTGRSNSSSSMSFLEPLLNCKELSTQTRSPCAGSMLSVDVSLPGDHLLQLYASTNAISPVQLTSNIHHILQCCSTNHALC
jgi:hypothetical protein